MLMITLKQFHELTPAEQLTMLWENGLYLASRQQVDASEVNLYQVGDFFVEICFYSLNDFRFVQAFADTGLLLPYLEQVNIDHLYK
ncbi:hypothetical protein [Adhaeribacter radiodurans]|uniref:Uncharacterized protein n=1 Tax=Adhaeribacter radiodurans TaxID=2745197 RepID=A0A7L7L129_9BACT|nr:hypothetical protein [Adhaeribacter radiodurans]QMU26503.1 hypothetical protein HUW48_00065 [Adhaeribacter radiodurans]